jgi:hypothetical protein
MEVQVKRGTALVWYAGAVASIIIGVVMAGRQFPGGFDWAYTVISRLGSSRHNPGGAFWLSGSLLVAVCLLWPVATHLGGRTAGAGRPRVAGAALRVGLIGGALLAMEGLLLLDLSRLGRKGHEVLALATFLGFYGGVLGLFVHRIRNAGAAIWPALLVMAPLCAVGGSQLALYLGQRDLGWVNTGWREMGVPLWLSFAFWQWLAVAFLALGLGYLVVASGRSAASGRTAASARSGR